MTTINKAKEKKEKLRKRQKNKCYWCKEQMNNKSHDLRECTLDHITPKSKNGTGEMFNLVACCRECNERRGNLDVGEWEMILKGWK